MEMFLFHPHLYPHSLLSVFVMKMLSFSTYGGGGSLTGGSTAVWGAAGVRVRVGGVGERGRGGKSHESGSPISHACLDDFSRRVGEDRAPVWVFG